MESERGQLSVSAQFQDLMKERVCEVGCWAGVTELEISYFSSFHLCPEFRSRDCEEEQEEGEGWEVCVAGVAW